MGAADVAVADAVTQYALAVEAGEIVAGPWVRSACARHLRDLEEGPARGLVWRPEMALRAMGFFEALKLADGEHADKPFALQLWQRFIVGSLFGWYGVDGFRRFRTAYVEIGKGNGKTPMAAALGLYMLVADGEAGAEVYSAAVSRDQAGICFRDASRFVESSPALARRITAGTGNLAYRPLAGFMRPVSSEGRGLDGKRVHAALIDELHEHSSSIVVDKMRAGTKGRRQAMIFEITNSGFDRQSVCYQHHEYSCKVLDGIIENDSWFAYVASLDEGDDPLTDPKCWIKANPNLGVSITEKYLAEQVAEARDISSRRNIVLRLNFCVWTEKQTVWMPLAVWDDNADVVDEESLRGHPCFGGLDLATVSDITANVWVFPPHADREKWAVVCRFWLPEDTVAERVRKARLPYDQWAREGWLRTTPGNICDYAFIRASILEDAERFDVRELAFDRWNATALVTELQDDGVPMVQFGQGFASMAGPMKEFERLLRSGMFAHGGNPVLRWMFSNLQVRPDPAGNVKPDRAASSEKIDGMVAMVMGVGLATSASSGDAGVIEQGFVVL